MTPPIRNLLTNRIKFLSAMSCSRNLIVHSYRLSLWLLSVGFLDHLILIAKATYCLPLPSEVITSFTSTMGGFDFSIVFIPTHHCIGRCSLLAHVQNYPGFTGMSNITLSGMPCSQTPVCSHSLALATNPCWCPKEVADHHTQSIIQTKLIHFMLSHYGIPVPCPTPKHHC